MNVESHQIVFYSSFDSLISLNTSDVQRYVIVMASISTRRVVRRMELASQHFRDISTYFSGKTTLSAFFLVILSSKWCCSLCVSYPNKKLRRSFCTTTQRKKKSSTVASYNDFGTIWRMSQCQNPCRWLEFIVLHKHIRRNRSKKNTQRKECQQ